MGDLYSVAAILRRAWSPPRAAKRLTHAKMQIMTRLLNDAITQLRTLSADEQDRIAHVVCALLEGPYELGAER